MERKKIITTAIKNYLNEKKEIKNNLNDNFFKWFGNSKMINEDGSPIIFYHGTDKIFNVFKKSKYGSNGPGVYLTPYREFAEMSGNIIMPVYVKIENELDGIIAGYEIVVKKINHIKSIKNDGTWDIDDNNIYS
jgi:hypothetical protein